MKNLRRTFEFLRGEDKTLKGQPYGDDIDIDALVDGWADVASGMEMPENIFTKMHKEERDIAVIFMVDMSGSTKGWINDAERESLVLLVKHWKPWVIVMPFTGLPVIPKNVAKFTP